MKKKPTKPEKGREVSKIERTGDTTFLMHHENGDTFEGTADPNKTRFAEDSRKTASRFHIPDKVGIKNVMSNKTRRKMGLEEDPNLAK